MSSDPTLDDQLCFSLYAASMAIGRIYKPVLDRLGITYPQYLVLFSLWEEDGRSIGAIAERLSLVSSTVTPLVKRLEGLGLVTRARRPQDERSVVVCLTETGRVLQEESRCLGMALLENSEMQPERLMALNAEVRALQQALDRRVRESRAPESRLKDA